MIELVLHGNPPPPLSVVFLSKTASGNMQLSLWQKKRRYPFLVGRLDFFAGPNCSNRHVHPFPSPTPTPSLPSSHQDLIPIHGLSLSFTKHSLVAQKHVLSECSRSVVFFSCATCLCHTCLPDMGHLHSEPMLQSSDLFTPCFEAVCDGSLPPAGARGATEGPILYFFLELQPGRCRYSSSV